MKTLKSKFVLIAAVFFMLTLGAGWSALTAAAPQQAFASGWKKFTQNGGNYTIIYPKNWQVNSLIGNVTNVDTFTLKRGRKDLATIKVYYYVGLNADSVSGPEKILKRQKVRLGGMRAEKQTFIDADKKRKVRVVTIGQSQITYSITLDNLSYLGTFNRMIQSFRLINKNL